VVLERERVLRGTYPLPREAVIGAFEALLAIHHLDLEQDHRVRQALDVHRHGMDFADALHHVRSEGCGAMTNFDRRHATRIAGQSRKSSGTRSTSARPKIGHQEGMLRCRQRATPPTTAGSNASEMGARP
jgi:hypothetical protein